MDSVLFSVQFTLSKYADWNDFVARVVIVMDDAASLAQTPLSSWQHGHGHGGHY